MCRVALHVAGGHIVRIRLWILPPKGHHVIGKLFGGLKQLLGIIIIGRHNRRAVSVERLVNLAFGFGDVVSSAKLARAVPMFSTPATSGLAMVV